MTSSIAKRPTKEAVTQALKVAAELAKIDGSGRYTGGNLVTTKPLGPIQSGQQTAKDQRTAKDK